ncbi:MAG: efflux RND transporter periplasmic adaptor subunit [Phycisphaerae bacterium]|nr:efflux RND transporter periplasmic adaptor subunit [Phycisphaerae bacterium]
MKKWIVFVVVLIIVAVLGWRVLLPDSDAASKGGARSTVVAVESVPIQVGEIRDIGVFTGSLEPKSQFVVASKVSGWLRQLLVNVGDRVTHNQLIAILDDAEFTQQAQQAQAELEVARANAANCAGDLAIAEREYDRAKALREKQIASVSELDVSEAAYNAAQTRHKVALAQVMQREAAYKAAEVRLSYTQIKAFWEEGEQTRVVGERFADQGTLLQANQSIVSILENNPLTAIVHVIERDYPKVRVGQQAVVTTDAYPDQAFSGQIVRIAPLLKESSRQARVEIEVPNPDLTLKPGMFVRARIEFSLHEQATLMPVAALVNRDEVEGVFMVDAANRTARFVPVKTGIITNGQAEILDPKLTEGEVITLGNHLLEQGSKIVLPGAESKVKP